MQTNAIRHAGVWSECWWCLCSLVQRMLCPRSPKKIFTFHHLHLTAEQFFRVVSVYCKWALCQSRQRHFRIIFKYGFFLHDRALTWIVWTPSAFTDSDLWECHAVLPEGRFSVLSLTHRDFSIFSDNIQNIIWDRQSLCISFQNIIQIFFS